MIQEQHPTEEHKKHVYPLIIKEQYLDYFGHVNHADYLTLFEEARWDWISAQGYDLERIVTLGYGPVILEANVQYKKELKARQKIVIESHVKIQERVVSIIEQVMKDDQYIYARAELKVGILDHQKRKLIAPPEDWKNALKIP